MNKIFTLLFSFCTLMLAAQTPCVDGMAGEYPCQNVDLLAHMSLTDIHAGASTSDVWGWVSPDSGREYALVGCADGTAFVDVSDPVNPVLIGFLDTHTVSSLWRDVETYNNYAFITSEADQHGLQVFDLMQLDAVVNPPADFEETTHYDGFGHCHTIDICDETGFAYANGTNTFSGGLHIVNIQDPLNPTLAGGFSDDGYTHDCHAVLYTGPDPDYIGHEVVMACNTNTLTIVDVTDKSDCQPITINFYQGTGYTHQGWFTKDFGYFLVDDELDEMNFDSNTRTHMFNVNDLDNVEHMGVFESDIASIDHNLYILDNFVYESNYTGGVRILDAIKIANESMSEIAYFDLYPPNNDPNFTGTWSNYPFLPSGTLLATSIYDGFFIVKPTMIVVDQNSWGICGPDEIEVNVTVNAELNFPLVVEIEGLPEGVAVSAGNFLEPETNLVTISGLSSLPVGSYDFNLLLTTIFEGQYEIPMHIDISAGSVITPLLASPANNQSVPLGENIVFNWEEQTMATGYEFQIAYDESFTFMIDQQEVVENSYDMLADLPIGVYYWRVSALNECGQSNFSNTNVLFVGIVSVDDNVGGKFIVYPNPASDELSISFSSLQVNTIRILDTAGRTLINRVIKNESSVTLDISELTPGLYFLDTGETTIQFVKY